MKQLYPELVSDKLSGLEIIVARSRRGNDVSEELLRYWQRTEVPSDLIAAWRQLVTAALLNYRSGRSARVRLVLLERFRSLSTRSSWDEDQLHVALVALASFLLGADPLIFDPKQYTNGGIPTEPGRHFRWGHLVSPSHHMETACLWAVLGDLSDSHKLREAAQSAIQWSRSTGGALTLFERESVYSQKMGAYLAPLLCGERPTQSSAYTMLLQDLLPESEVSLAKGGICDFDSTLLGHIGEENACWMTLQGAGTGLGCASWGEVELVNYGPSRLPVGELAAFGVYHDPHLHRSAGVVMERDDEGCPFQMSGRVSLVDGPDVRPYPIWLDVCQRWQGTRLDLEVESIQDPVQNEAIALNFYFRADRCLVGREEQLIPPRSLKKHVGVVDMVTLQSGEQSIRLDPGFMAGELSVIPLVGNQHFWSADYLVAYTIDGSQQKSSWSIQPELMPL